MRISYPLDKVIRLVDKKDKAGPYEKRVRVQLTNKKAVRKKSFFIKTRCFIVSSSGRNTYLADCKGPDFPTKDFTSLHTNI